MHNVRIFVSSPGDVGEERALAARVIERLSGWFSGRLVLLPYFWEHEPLRAVATFQDQIDRPSKADIVVCILWSRLGTRLPPDYERADGSVPTGTEFEFEDAVLSHRERGLPDLLVYRKTATMAVPLDLEEATYRSLRAQRQALDAFFGRWFRAAGDDFLTGAFHKFTTSAEFEERLEIHLRKLLESRIHNPADQVRAPTPWWSGSPFRGLEVFDIEHAPVFFGRTKAVEEVIDAVRRQAAAGRAFVLAMGMSGCGKSSLIRAGVLPMLTQPGVIEGVGLCRWAIAHPGKGASPLHALAEALLHESAIPELGTDGTTAEQLSSLLREAPASVHGLVKGALSQAAAELARADGSERQPVTRLFLVVDQLEELFTTQGLAPEDRLAFVKVLDVLARSGLVWVLATLRSDFYPRLHELPALVALKEGAGQYDLLPPAGSEIAQVIRQPALAAGLVYEEQLETGRRLDDLLRDAALQDPSALPLLQFTLEQLYERREERTLTLDAYRELGGVEGALATRAETVFQALPVPSRTAFPTVMRALVDVNESGANPVARRTPLDLASRSMPARIFVDAFVEARLLTADRREDGTATVRLAHEALLRRWPRLRDWLREDAELLRVRARVEAAATRWSAEGRRADLLLPGGRPLLEAQDLARAEGVVLDDEQRDFLSSSMARAKRARRLSQLATAGLAVLTVLAVVLAVVAGQARDEARVRADEAEAASGVAVAAQERAVQSAATAEHERRLAQARWLATEAQAAFEQHPQRALLLAVEAVRAAPLPIAEEALRSVLASSAGVRLPGDPEFLYRYAVSPDGGVLVASLETRVLNVWSLQPGVESRQPIRLTVPDVGRDGSGYSQALAVDSAMWRVACAGTSDGGIRLWDLRDEAGRGHPVVLQGHEVAPNKLLFSRSGTRLISAEPGYTAGGVPRILLWDVDASSSPEPVVLGQVPGLFSVDVSADGESVAAGDGLGGVTLWDLTQTDAAGSAQRLVVSEGRVQRVRFEGSRWLLVASGPRLTILDLEEPEPLRSPLVLPDQEGFLYFAQLDPSSRWLLTEGGGGTPKLWRFPPEADDTPHLLSGHYPKPIVGIGIGEGTFTGYSQYTQTLCSALFSDDGTWLFTGGYDRVIRGWRLRSEDPAAHPLVLSGHEGAVSTLALSPDGALLVSGGAESWGSLEYDKSIRVWDLSAPSPAATGAVVRGHEQRVAWMGFVRGSRGLVSLGQSSTARFTDLSDPVPSPTPKSMVTSAAIGHLAVSATGDWLLAGGSDGRVWLCHPREDGVLVVRCTLRHEAHVTAVAFTPDERWAVTGCAGGTVRLWDLETENPAAESVVLRPGGPEEHVRGFATTPNGRWLTCAVSDPLMRSQNRRIPVWDLHRSDISESVRTLALAEEAVAEVAISEDGTWLAASGASGSVCLWALAAEGPLEPARHAFRAGALPSPRLDGGRLAVIGPTGGLDVWELRDNDTECLVTLRISAGETLNGLELASQGQTVIGVVSAGGEELLHVWRLGASKQAVHVHVLRGHDTAIRARALSRDGTLLATGQENGAIRVWDLATGEHARSAALEGHVTPVTDLCFDAEGRRLFSSSVDGTVRTWTLDLETLNDYALSLAGRNLSFDEWQTYYPGTDYRTTSAAYPVHPSVVPSLLERADALLANGDLDGARRLHERVQRLSGEVESDVAVWLRRTRAVNLLARAEDLARTGRTDEAQTLYEEAAALDPDSVTSSEGVATVRAHALRQDMVAYASNGRFDRALVAYEDALRLRPDLLVSQVDLNALCWGGALAGHASRLLDACEHLVRVSDEASLAGARDTRGLVRALNGDLAGALDDFRAFVEAYGDVEQIRDLVERRRGWIETLGEGRSPFDEETLRLLLRDETPSVPAYEALGTFVTWRNPQGDLFWIDIPRGWKAVGHFTMPGLAVARFAPETGLPHAFLAVGEPGEAIAEIDVHRGAALLLMLVVPQARNIRKGALEPFREGMRSMPLDYTIQVAGERTEMRGMLILRQEGSRPALQAFFSPAEEWATFSAIMIDNLSLRFPDTLPR